MPFTNSLRGEPKTMEYVYPADVLPDMQYTEPQKKPERCGMCTHGHVTNAGAVIPGYHCRLMERLFEESGITNGNDCVDSRLGVCRHFKNWKDAKREAEGDR